MSNPTWGSETRLQCSWPSGCRMIKGGVEKRTILVLSFAAYENNQERWIDWACCLVRDRSGYAGRERRLRKKRWWDVGSEDILRGRATIASTAYCRPLSGL